MSIKHERIGLNDNLKDAILKLAEGNPGAAVVCTKLAFRNTSIDPDSAMGVFSSILGLDTLGIYGPRIWMLYKDFCGQDLVTTIGVLRAWQLGFLSESKLNHAIDHYGDGVDIDELMKSVRERLPNFAKGGE